LRKFLEQLQKHIEFHLNLGYSAPRNIFLVKSLDNMRYINGLGRGIPLMKRAMQEQVRFEEIGGFVSSHAPLSCGQ
jgi:predicted HTH transcriptional regulator